MNTIGNVAHSVKTNKDSWLRNFARFGLASKGAVHCLVGGLAVMAAFGQGGQNGGSQDAFKFLYEQPFGFFLLILLAIGLIGYAVWRFIQTFKDPDHNGSDKKGIIKRIGFAISGIVYSGFAIYIIRMLIKSGSSGRGGVRQQAVAELLSKPFGQVLVFAIGAIVIIRGFIHIYKAYSGKFKNNIADGGMNRKARKFFDRAGKVGYTARGIVWAIIGFFLIQAALQSDPSEAQGTGGVFKFLESTGGPIILGLIALGFFCYGLFMFVKAKYRIVKV